MHGFQHLGEVDRGRATWRLSIANQSPPASAASHSPIPSGSPGALLRRGPLRTSACGFHRTGLKQAHWVTGFRDAVKIR